MLAETNPYIAPQITYDDLPQAQFVCLPTNRFPMPLVWQGLRQGANAGLIASLVMLSVFVFRTAAGAKGELSDLLMICAWYMAATSALGLFWGVNHGVIVWCLMRWLVEVGN
jgi:hypothetical protein